MHLFGAICLSTIAHSARGFTLFMRNRENRLASAVSIAKEDYIGSTVTNTATNTDNKSLCESLTLAGPFLVRYEACQSSVRFMLRNFRDELIDAEKCETFPTESSRAWAFLHSTTQITGAQSAFHNNNNKDVSVLNVELNENLDDNPTIRCSFSSPNARNSVDVELLSVLSRVLVQDLLSRVGQQQKSDESTGPSCTKTLMIFPNGDKETVLLPRDTDMIHSALFRKYTTETTEVIPMVDQMGRKLGYVPRSLVHQYNLLHRGVGILVANGDDIYCHRRTSTKRIFPSMYDMFVGGVSVAGEGDKWATARRELAEELGIHCGDCDSNANRLQYLWQCTVCTDYNRCVVDVFRCNVVDRINTTITWQEEEVAWGAWVPQNVVRAAADRSILRCQDWPGQYPKIQSYQRGELFESSSTGRFGDWSQWDFVPDGLLVWEALLRRSIEEL